MRSKGSAASLGLLSIGIGLAEILATRKLEKAMGINNGQNSGIMRAMGVRELMHGMDILSHKNPASGVWGRVAGDVLDTALLGMAATKTKNPRRFALIAGLVLAIGVADTLIARKMSAKNHRRF